MLNAEDGYLNHLVFSLLQEYPLVQSIIAILLVFFQASFINYIVNNNRIARVPNLLPGLVYILFVSIIPAFQILSPILIATTFLLTSIHNCFKCSQKHSTSGKIFNTSFFISIASLFYFPFIIFVIAAFLSLLTIRSFKLKERLQFLLGALIPFLLFGTYFNWYSALYQYLPGYMASNTVLPDIANGFSTYEIVTVGSFLGLAIFSFFKYNEFRKKKTVASQKKIDILYWFLFLTIPSLFFWKNLGLDHLIILIPTLSIFFGMFLLGLKNKFLAEIIHVMALLALFIPQFQF